MEANRSFAASRIRICRTKALKCTKQNSYRSCANLAVNAQNEVHPSKTRLPLIDSWGALTILYSTHNFFDNFPESLGASGARIGADDGRHITQEEDEAGKLAFDAVFLLPN